MKTEYELRVLEIEPKSIINRLEELGAVNDKIRMYKKWKIKMYKKDRFHFL